jgi:hypothetical protein
VQIVPCQSYVVLLLKLFHLALLFRHQFPSQLNEVFLAGFLIVDGGDAEVVETVSVEQFSVFFQHAEEGARGNIQPVLLLKLFEDFDHLQRFQSVAFYFGEIFDEEFGSFFVAAEEEELGDLGFILHVPVVVVWKRRSCDHLDKLVVLNFIELAPKGLEGGEGIDLEMCEKLVVVLLVLGIVDLGVDPIIGHLPHIAETHLR